MKFIAKIFLIITSLIYSISPKDISDKCYLPKKTGPCKAYFVRYYYNYNTNKCEKFVYGGCQGNENNFESLRECIDECIETNS